MGGNIESAVNGAFSAALFYGVGELSGAHEAAAAGRSMTGAEHLAQTFGHAVVGCVSASIAGGSCGSGAASAAFAYLFNELAGRAHKYKLGPTWMCDMDQSGCTMRK